jgi:regulator of sigma E protease
MFGDADASSGLPAAGLAACSSGRRRLVHYKRLGQRAAIVAAGPAANFVFAIVVLAVLFTTFGQPFTPAEVGQVQPGSAAEQGGIRPGDLMLKIDGRPVARFEDVQQAVRLNPGVPMAIVVRRDGRDIELQITPIGLR